MSQRGGIVLLGAGILGIVTAIALTRRKEKDEEIREVWFEERVDFKDGLMRFVWICHNDSEEPVTVTAVRAHWDGTEGLSWSSVLAEKGGWMVPAGRTAEWAYGWTSPKTYGFKSGTTHTDFYEILDNTGKIYKTNTITFLIP